MIYYKYKKEVWYIVKQEIGSSELVLGLITPVGTNTQI